MSLILDWLKANQPVPYVEFMQQALYAPSGGYYASLKPKFGKEGDFITSPEMTPLFGACLAAQCKEMFEAIEHHNILEFGAGSGRLCIDVLVALEQQNALPENYFILEVSGGMKAFQQEAIKREVPHLASKVTWLTSWPEQFTGVMLANEVLDAMPVHRFMYDQDQLWDSYIAVDGEQLIEHWREMEDGPIKTYITDAILPLSLPQPYYSEVNWLAKGWLEQLSQTLVAGGLIVIDYGFPRHEYYHPQRAQGTIMCHHQHHAHPDFLDKPGEQDITAHVDFTFIAEVAHDAGLHVAGYTNQAAFLVNNGLLSLVKEEGDSVAAIKQNKAITCLTHPAEMGELFKVIALTKHIDAPLQGFTIFDKRASL